jgi:Fe-S-cluster-containing hydrogenase component 2
VTYCDPPLYSLQSGHWFKLICGASFQHLPAVRSLALTYALAGADCVDVAPDPAVVAAARSGLAAAATQMARAGLAYRSPLLMISLNDGEDPHFRKVQFDPRRCPEDCLRPCERVCPAQAIPPLSLGQGSKADSTADATVGVIEARCYGCGRCVPICPIGLIEAQSHLVDPAVAMAMAAEGGIDALEIHTQVGRVEDFRRLWRSIEPWISSLKLVAISCPNPEGGAQIVDYLADLERIMGALPCPHVWQTDGRSMSGDIGAGTTHPAIKLAQHILAAQQQGHLGGFVQLAGGTNAYTVPKLQQLQLLAGVDRTGAAMTEPIAGTVAGVAYGSYARSLLAPVLDPLEDRSGDLDDDPESLRQALELAAGLARPLKARSPELADRYDQYYQTLQRSLHPARAAPT